MLLLMSAIFNVWLSVKGGKQICPLFKIGSFVDKLI